MKIRIDELDMSLQTRAGTDAETVENYADAMADGAKFPDVAVFTDGERFWLADGFHRVEAAKRNGRTVIGAEVMRGGEDDAVVYGGTANNRQGKRPTREDMRHFLQMVWDRREAIFGGTPTGGNLAKRCGVSSRMAENFVRERLAEMPKAPSRPRPHNAEVKAPVRPAKLVGADGKMYAPRPIPEPAPEPVPEPVQAPVRRPAPVAPQRPQKPAHVVPVDRYGVEIPLEINAAFEGGVLADLLATISKARVALRKGLEDKLPQFAAIRQDALVNLNNAYSFVAAADPHCVCRMCQGTGCKACHGRGWQTEDEYKRNPKEFQA